MCGAVWLFILNLFILFIILLLSARHKHQQNLNVKLSAYKSAKHLLPEGHIDLFYLTIYVPNFFSRRFSGHDLR